jgi:hypothetical protein
LRALVTVKLVISEVLHPCIGFFPTTDVHVTNPSAKRDFSAPNEQ